MATEEGTASLETLIDGAESAAVAPPERVAEPTSVDKAPVSTGEKDVAAAPPAEASLSPVDDGPTVPRKALEDERRKRQEFEKQLQELVAAIRQSQQQQPQEQTPQGPPDVWTDPEGAIAWHQEQNRREVLITKVNISEHLMSEKPDYPQNRDFFIEAAEKDRSLWRVFAQHPMPAKFAYDIGRKYAAQKEIGDDPAAYKERIKAELLAELQGGSAQPVQQLSAPKAPAPKSLAGQPSAQPRDQKGRFAEGPASLESILGG